MPDTPLHLEVTDSAATATFQAFYAGYRRSFVLPDEMEDEDGFRRCLDLNHGEARRTLESRYGPFIEQCLVLRLAPDGPIVGGANFIALQCPRAGGGHVVTANLNYIFILPEHRGQGLFGKLVAAVRDRVAHAFPVPCSEALVFIEQNDPLRMSAEAYRRDTTFTGMDQFDRLAIWARQGTLVVDVDYVQPPLSAGQEADAALVYSVLGAPTRDLAPAVLHNHLRGFFGISVMKGGALHDCAVAQLDALARLQSENATIALLDPMPALNAASHGARIGASFREFARLAAVPQT